MYKCFFLTLLLFSQGSTEWTHPYKENTTFTQYLFPDLQGPNSFTPISPIKKTFPQNYQKGLSSRLAILLTQKDSHWLGLVKGLKTIGIPFLITEDENTAFQHQVILVYPNLPKNLTKLLSYISSGGIALTFQDITPIKNLLNCQKVFTAPHISLQCIKEHPYNISFNDDPPFRITSSQYPLQTFQYQTPNANPILKYEDDSFAMIESNYNKGKILALGFDLGTFLIKSYTLKNENTNLAHELSNHYTPSVDTLLRLLKILYHTYEKDAVTIGTVPEYKSLSVLLTHDIHDKKEMKNALFFAKSEAKKKVLATYFLQAKYMTDYMDFAYFTDEALPQIKVLQDLHMELGAHSVVHGKSYPYLPIGSGKETYPSYHPVSIDKNEILQASLLGELRVSQFLLSHFLNKKIPSWRSPALFFPTALPECLEATHLTYSSSTTANICWTHLPFQLNYHCEDSAEVSTFEFPVTLFDTGLEKLSIENSFQLAKKLSSYGGLFIVLIHPQDITDRIQFQEALIDKIQEFSWIGTLSQLGEWWVNRNTLEIDVISQNKEKILLLHASPPAKKITLHIPSHWKLKTTQKFIQQIGNELHIEQIDKDLQIPFIILK
ncbi:MAG: hypothetical protein WCP39_00150 [Chlamydiota bacterium]